MSFAALSLLGTALVVVAALLLRSRTYAAFRAVSLGLHSAIAIGIAPLVTKHWELFVYLHVCVYVHALVLVRPRMRGIAYRALISIPAAFFSAGTLLSFPWAIASAFDAAPGYLWLPYVLAAVGVLQSLYSRTEEVDVVVSAHNARSLSRCPPEAARVERPLRVVQLTDTHLGPFMSVARLRRICERAVAAQPDLVVLTGDFLTMESQHDPKLLGAALSPLSVLKGRVFACRGNHDHEAPEVVSQALEHAGVQLLVDRACSVTTDAGLVDVLGIDYVFRNRAAHIAQVAAAHARRNGAFRLVLLHDPGGFKHIPAGAADLVLSGHTHGGQVGLVSMGLPWTLMRVLMNAPDHGLWARGLERLYVHRGTGHYGFPLRLGVPAEESVLRVHAVR